MIWKFEENKGISNLALGFELFFGKAREEIRQKLNYSEKCIGRFENEDSYENIMLSNTWIRLTFHEEVLVEIEFLMGQIQINNIVLDFEKSSLKKTIHKLNKAGYTFIETELSYLCEESKFDIGDFERNGGEEDLVAWFYTAKSVDHLKTS